MLKIHWTVDNAAFNIEFYQFQNDKLLLSNFFSPDYDVELIRNTINGKIIIYQF
jgi:hypothetical protein